MKIKVKIIIKYIYLLFDYTILFIQIINSD